MRSVERKMVYDGKTWVDSRLAFSLIKLNFFSFNFSAAYSVKRKLKVAEIALKGPSKRLQHLLQHPFDFVEWQC